jgi:hypothetical protein
MTWLRISIWCTGNFQDIGRCGERKCEGVLFIQTGTKVSVKIIGLDS